MIYRIVCDGVDLYGPDVEHSVLNPHLEIELNAAGTLEFTLPIVMGDEDGKYQQINGDIWRSPNVFKSEIWVFEEDRIIWFGRPLQITRDWNNQRRVVCEGALAYFNDSIQRTWEMKPKKDHSNTNISFFRHIITNHNLQVDTNREFSIGNITVESEDAYRKTDYDTTYDCLQNMCLAVNGGYIILRKEFTYDNWHSYIDWVSEMPEESVQPVEFGLNMLDVNQDLNGADVCTVLIATGKDDCTFNNLGNITPSEETDWIGHDAGSDEIWHQKGVERFGRVVQQKSWNEFTATGGRSSGLWHKATDWLINKNKEITTIEVSAADLHYIGDYADQADYNFFRVGMKVSVISGPHDLQQKELIIYKLSMDLDTGVKKVTIGTPPKRELTDIIAPNSGSGSTRGNGSTGGGDGGSSSGSGGGGGSVTIPVKDVQVKMPGEDDYSSVVTKKIAKIDLSDISGGGSVEDVKVNGVSVVDPETHEADIQLPEVPVQDVQVDGVSVVDEDGIADISSAIGGAVQDVTVDGVSVLDNEDHIAKIDTADILENNPTLLADFEKIINQGMFAPETVYGRPTDMYIEVDRHRTPSGEIEIMSHLDPMDNITSPSAAVKAGFATNASPGLWNHTHESLVTQYPELENYAYYEQDWMEDGYPRNLTFFFIGVENRNNINWWYDHVTTYSDDLPEPDEKDNAQMKPIMHPCYIYIGPNYTGEFTKHFNEKVKVTSVTGVFKFTLDEAVDESHNTQEYHHTIKIGYPNNMIKREVDGDTATIIVYGSDDGVTWDNCGTYDVSAAVIDVPYTVNINCNKYYSYIRVHLLASLNQNLGYKEFSVKGIYESDRNYINQIWYKYDNFEWICQDVSHVVANPSGTATNDLTKLQIDNTIYNIPIPTVIDVEANPVDPATAHLNTIKIDNTVYDIPTNNVEGNASGTPDYTLESLRINSTLYSVPQQIYVEANPSGNVDYDLNKIQIGQYIYDIIDVVGNPVGTTDYTLEGIKIGNSIYRPIDIEANPSGTVDYTLNSLKVGNYIYQPKEVEANPQDQAYYQLSSLKIGTDVFYILDVEANPVGTPDYTLESLKVGNYIYKPTEVQANPSGTPDYTLDSLKVGDYIYELPTPGTYVEANPSGSTIGDLTSIQIGQYSYDIPVGTEVEANPSDTTIGDLTSIKIGSYAYDIPSGGGGTTVIGNPQGTPSYVLNSIQIGNDIFSIPSGGGGSSHTWSTTAQQVGTWIDGTTVYEKSFYITNLTANTWTDVAHGISGIGKVIDIRGTVTLASSGGAYATCDDYKFRCQSSNLGVYCGSGTPDYAIVVLTYTLGSGNNTRYQIVSKDTTGYDAAITVNKFVNNVLISSTDYRYDDIFSPVTIDNKIQIVYNDSPYQYTYTLLAASADHASGYSYSWDYDQSVDISETFT